MRLAQRDQAACRSDRPGSARRRRESVPHVAPRRTVRDGIARQLGSSPSDSARREGARQSLRACQRLRRWPPRPSSQPPSAEKAYSRRRCSPSGSSTFCALTGSDAVSGISRLRRCEVCRSARGLSRPPRPIRFRSRLGRSECTASHLPFPRPPTRARHATGGLRLVKVSSPEFRAPGFLPTRRTGGF